jgi:hypothetical protein
MRRIIRTALVAVVFSGLSAAAGCYPPPSNAVFVARRPPPPPYDIVGARPGPGFAWMMGFWGWNGGAYLWYPGRWAPIPRGYHAWMPGRWLHERRGWYWRPGHWR